MTRLEREALVERYLACEMKAHEERAFAMQVATDPELFETLRAYRYMEHTLRGDSSRLLGAESLSETSLLAALSAPATPHGQSAVGAAGRAGFFTQHVATFITTTLVAGSLGYLGHALVSAEPEPVQRTVQTAPSTQQIAPPTIAPSAQTQVPEAGDMVESAEERNEAAVESAKPDVRTATHVQPGPAATRTDSRQKLELPAAQKQRADHSTATVSPEVRLNDERQATSSRARADTLHNASPKIRIPVSINVSRPKQTTAP